MEIAVAYEEEHQLQLAWAVAHQAADHLGLLLAAAVAHCSGPAAAPQQQPAQSMAAPLLAAWPLLRALLLPRAVADLLGMLIRQRFHAVEVLHHWHGWSSAARCSGMLLPATAMAVLWLPLLLRGVA